MHRINHALLLFAIASCGCSQSAFSLSSATSQGDEPAPKDINWPELPTSGFVAGRAATPDDFEAGNAAFAACGTVTSDALQIEIAVTLQPSEVPGKIGRWAKMAAKRRFRQSTQSRETSLPKATISSTFRSRLPNFRRLNGYKSPSTPC